MSNTPEVAVVLIVRNEAGRIGRALDSVRNAVDSWLIIDTGSSDATIEEIRSVTAEWPGILLERPWIDFGANRTEAMQEARRMKIGRWLLTIDADHVVRDADQIRSAVASADKERIDALLMPFTSVPLMWTPRLLRADRPWRYVGATREYLTCDRPFSQGKVEFPRIEDLADGASRTNKFRRDIEILRAELASDPDKARAWFCLGESYRGIDQHELAAMAYTNCAIKTHSAEERYWSLTMSGEMLLAYGETEDGLGRLLLANEERPQRREALLMACQVLNQMGRHVEVMSLLGHGAIERPIPEEDLVAIVPDAYGSGMVREHDIARSSH